MVGEPDDPRLVELEARYTLQADALAQLSEVLWSQRKEIDALKAKVSSLERRVAELTAAGDEHAADEVPPHY
jgi:uncharacterized coiled-coil protein SlyX